MSLTEEMALAAIAAARKAASGIGVPMNIAVLDAGAHLKAFARMDGALLGSIDIALGKAKTSALFGMPSEAVGEFCKPGGSSPGLELTNGTLVVFAGGVPIHDSRGAVIGAVGVSGGAVQQDRQVAQAAAEAAKSSGI
jgi:uncharacterized protein GlcG (DUF336 family)